MHQPPPWVIQWIMAQLPHDPIVHPDVPQLRQQQRADWLRRCREQLAGIDDPTVRLLMVMAGTTSIDTHNQSVSSLHATDWDAVRQLALPAADAASATPSPSAGSAPWRQDEIQNWFLAHVTAPPGDLTVVTRRGLITRHRHVAGWLFRRGCTRISTGNTKRAFDLILTDDGGRLLCPGDPRRPATETDEGFNGRALTEMAALTGLLALPRLGGSTACAFS